MDTLHRRPAEASSRHDSSFAEPFGLGTDLLIETWHTGSMPTSQADFSAQVDAVSSCMLAVLLVLLRLRYGMRLCCSSC